MEVTFSRGPEDYERLAAYWSRSIASQKKKKKKSLTEKKYTRF